MRLPRAPELALLFGLICIQIVLLKKATRMWALPAEATREEQGSALGRNGEIVKLGAMRGGLARDVGSRRNPRAWEGRWVLFPRLDGAKISSTNPKPSDPQREVAKFHSEVTRAKYIYI